MSKPIQRYQLHKEGNSSFHKDESGNLILHKDHQELLQGLLSEILSHKFEAPRIDFVTTYWIEQEFKKLGIE